MALRAYNTIQSIEKWLNNWRNVYKLTKQLKILDVHYLSELRRDFLASVGITYAVFRIAKSRLRAFGEIC